MSTYYDQTFSPFLADEDWVHWWNISQIGEPESFACDECKHLVGWINHLPSNKCTFSPFWVMDEDVTTLVCEPCKDRQDLLIAEDDAKYEREYARYLWWSNRAEYHYQFGPADFVEDEPS